MGKKKIKEIKEVKRIIPLWFELEHRCQACSMINLPPFLEEIQSALFRAKDLHHIKMTTREIRVMFYRCILRDAPFGVLSYPVKLLAGAALARELERFLVKYGK